MMRSIIYTWLVFACLSFSATLAAAETAPGAEASPQPEPMHTSDMPARGLSMREVEKQFGKPIKVLPPTGNTSKLRPPITRWVYDDFIVYFEKNLVIHSARPRNLEKFRHLKESPSASDSAP